jgi:hypothetical protein
MIPETTNRNARLLAAGIDQNILDATDADLPMLQCWNRLQRYTTKERLAATCKNANLDDTGSKQVLFYRLIAAD